MPDPSPVTLRFLDYELTPAEGTLRRNGELVELQPKVFEALVYFAHHPERLVTKQELLATLWPDTVVEEASLTQVIHKLRRALGEGRGEPRVLHTVLKRGFRLAVAVERQATPPPGLAPYAPAPTPAPFEPAATLPPLAPTPALFEPAATLSTPDSVPVEPAPAPAPVEPTPAPEPGPAPAPPPTSESVALPPPTSTPAPPRTARRRRLLGALAASSAAATALAFTLGHSGPQPRQAALLGDPTTRLTTRLTRLPERDQEPALAPDLTWFAFASTRGTGGPYAIWVQRLDGGDPVQITRPPRGEDTSPRVFPDGRAVAFTRCDTTNPHAPGCAVWRAAPLGGDERLLAADCNLGDLRADGRSLVCMRGTEDGRVAFVEVALDAPTSARTLFEWAGPTESLRLASTGHLAFLSGGDPWLVAPGSAEAVRLLPPGANTLSLAFDGAGTHLLLDLSAKGRRTLWALPIDPPAPDALEPLTLGGGVDLYPELARDGSRLLYTHETSESVLYQVDARGRSPRRLDTRTSFLGLSLGGRGKWLAVWDGDSPSGDDSALLDLAEVPTHGLGELAVATTPRAFAPLVRGLGRGGVPALSRDEDRVALVDAGALVLVDLGTGTRTTLAHDVREVRPAFSPDGASLAFARTGPRPGLMLHRFGDPAETPTPTLLVEGHFTAPSFSPDGRYLAACGGALGDGPSGLHLIDLHALGPLRGDAAQARPTPTPGVADEARPTRWLSPLRSYEAAPLWLEASPGFVWLLVDERTTPRLVPVPLTGDAGPTPPAPIELEVPRDPANWGVFEVQAHPHGGLVFILKRVYSDIMTVYEDARPAPR